MYSLSLISMTVLFLREGVKFPISTGVKSWIDKTDIPVDGIEKKCYADIVEVPANC